MLEFAIRTISCNQELIKKEKSRKEFFILNRIFLFSWLILLIFWCKNLVHL